MGWGGRLGAGERGERVAGGLSPDPAWIGLLGGLVGGFAGGVGALSTPKHSRAWGFSPPGAGSRLEERRGAGGALAVLGSTGTGPKQHLGGSWAQSRG